MCPACIASALVLLSGGAYSALLVWRSRPACDEMNDREGDDDHEPSEDRLAG